MVDSILATENVVVTGGPATIKLMTDFGPEGDRGGLILYGLDKPQNLPIEQFPQRPQLLDWYINLKTSDDEYLYLYQYQNIDGVNQWFRIFKIIPNVYNTNETVTFVDGVASFNLLVSNTTAPLLGEAEIKLNTHVDIQTTSAYPIASSFAFGIPTFDSGTGDYILPMTITAVEFTPPPTPVASAVSLAAMLALTGLTTGNAVYRSDINQIMVFIGSAGTESNPASWTYFNAAAPLDDVAVAHISINVV